MSAAADNNLRPDALRELTRLVSRATADLAEAMAILDQLCRSRGTDEPSGQGDLPVPGGRPVFATGSCETAGAISEVRLPHRPAWPPPLHEHDMRAYQLSRLARLKQVEVAKALNTEYGTTYSQGQVSRMIRRAKRHMEATGLPDLAGEPAKRAESVDPSVLELGRRTDGRRTDGCRSKRRADDE